MQTFTHWESDIRGYCRANPAIFAKADNALQWDENGRRFIDLFAGAGVVNFGHNNPKMVAAVIEYLQGNGVIHSLDLHTVAKREFINAFAEIVLKPRNMNHKLQFMGPTGTNAVEAALKLARKATGRSQIATFTNGYHGVTLGSLACTGNNYFRQAAGVNLTDVVHLPFETAAGGGVEQLHAYRETLLDSSSGVNPPAAFLVEAIQSEGGVNIASKAWLQTLEALAKEVGALLIVDDIQVGCGRTGSYFSFDDMGISPDIICLAKGIGGLGTPMAMNLNKPEYDKHWQPGEHTGTFRGQNLSFVAGKVALEYFKDENLIHETHRKGEIMAEYLNELVAKYPAMNMQVRGKGMMQAIDVGDGDVVKTIAKHCFEHGIIICQCGTGGSVIKLIPPLTIEDDILKEGLDGLQQCFAKALA